MDQFTNDELKKLVEEIDQRPTVYMNSKTHEAVSQQMDFVPAHIEVSNIIPDNQVIIFSKEQMDKMRNGFYFKL